MSCSGSVFRSWQILRGKRILSGREFTLTGALMSDANIGQGKLNVCVESANLDEYTFATFTECDKTITFL